MYMLNFSSQSTQRLTVSQRISNLHINCAHYNNCYCVVMPHAPVNMVTISKVFDVVIYIVCSLLVKL